MIEGLESLVLIGTVDTPRGLITDPKKRVAYIPDPNFVGADSFAYRGDDSPARCVGLECDQRANDKRTTVSMYVNNVNDRPKAGRTDVTGKAGQQVLFQLAGSDGLLDDQTFAWRDLQKDDPSLYGGGYPISVPDFSGRPDGEPDSQLVATITTPPDRGTMTWLGGRNFRFDPPAGAGGAPYAILRFTVTDAQGLVSDEGIASLTVRKREHISTATRACRVVTVCIRIIVVVASVFLSRAHRCCCFRIATLRVWTVRCCLPVLGVLLLVTDA